MRSKKFLSFCAALLTGATALAQTTNPLWMRYPAISPDGKTIAFCYKGDIYSVDSKGGRAYALTNSESYDFMPTWSPDGKWLAFASDRNGNYDVYLMPAEGGNSQRLTYNSSNDLPWCFSPDGKTVYFSATRMDVAKYTQFPAGNLNELYAVSTGGGRENMVLSVAVEALRSNKAGDKFLFQDKKGGEDQWRKHHTSSITRDLWLYEKNGNKYTKLTSFEGEDRNPVWSNDEKEMFYLSEKSGSINVWKMALDNPSSATQVTNYAKDPVRFLSLSNTNVLCFGFNGEIFTQPVGGSATKLEVTLTADEHLTEGKTEAFTTGATETAISPNGKEMVFVVRGEVFVTSVENGTTKRITDTPGQERNVSFSPDGKSILYASERNNIWGLYQTKLTRKEEKYFFNSTLLTEETILAGKNEAFQPAYSPDGKEVAFLEDRTAVKVINLASKAVRTIMPAEKNYSYSDGDQSFEWSPDGKYILVHFLQDDNWLTEVGLVDAEGKNPMIDVTQSGFGAGGGAWAANGNVIVYFSDRHGMKNVASHGRESDAYGLFLNKAFYDRFKLSKEEYALLKEREDKEKGGDKSKDKKDSTAKTIKPIKIEFEGLQDRKLRLTMHSSHLAGAILSNDGEKLFYVCKFEKGYDLWQTKFKEKETKILCKLDAGHVGSFQMDKEGKNLYMVSDGNLVKVEIEKGEKKSVSFNAEMNLNTYAEREYMFEHEWRQVKRKFYVTDLQKTDWDYYKTNYVRFLPHINNNRDFSEMMSELLGELNASHTGCFYRPKFKNADETAQLGAFFDETYTGKGLKIVEVLEKGPLNYDGTQIKAGTIIEKIDGVDIEANTNYFKLLNRKVGKPVLLSLFDGTKRWDETVRPINSGQLSSILYMRWIKRMQEMTDKLSGGTLAYMHVYAMNDEAYREFYDQVMGKYSNKKALIVDTRFNGGGWLHDDLATFLSGKRYIEFVPRERKIGNEPGTKWTKPSCVLMSEGNYSDAHMFPVVYRTLGIGKLVGMPVPGTGTAVWWETLQDPTLVFGIPQVGVKSPDGKYYENNQLEPDVKVVNDYNAMLEGKDQQLEAAVNLLMGK